MFPENPAWLVRSLLESGLPDRSAVRAAGAIRLILGPGPSYLAPAVYARYGRGIAGALRWFVPGQSEAAVFFWLFMLATGWNMSTACGIDVSDPEGWWQPHPQSDRFVVIHAFKNRADRHQFAISMTKPQGHPFKLLQYFIERTAPLRRQVLTELAQMRRRAAADPNARLAGKIDRLEQLSRSPWLFASRGQVGTVSGFVGGNSKGLIEVVRAVAESNGLVDRYPQLLSITTADPRHAWIGHAYVQSGYQVLLTRLAGSHATLRSTMHYIRSHRYREHSEVQVRKLQDAVFSEIESGRIVDPTRLRLLVASGSITAEQETRLADLRQRTRVGMGCLNPTSPPREVDPDHREGALCRVQRCTGCPNGVVFPESLSPLARRYAGLLHLRRSMPMTGWEKSSLSDEYASIGETLQRFDAARVTAEVDDWTRKLNSGEIEVHGTYPQY